MDVLISWIIGFTLCFGVAHFIGSWISNAQGNDKHTHHEAIAILWFILTVLIYGVFK